MTGNAGAADREAETRVLRTIAAIFGVSTVVFLFLTIGSIVDEWRFVSPIWSIVAVAVIFGAPPVIAIVSAFICPTTIKRVLGAYAIASLIITLCYPLALVHGPMPFQFSPWPLTIIALATVPAALAWRERTALAYLIAYSVGVAIVRVFSGIDPQPGVAVQDAVFSFTLAGLFTVLAVVTMRSAMALDAAAASARETAVRRASLESGQREQARLDALLHDDVMSTLFYASKGTPELDAAVRRQAAHALTELRKGDDAVEQSTDIAAFTSRLRSVALSGAGGGASGFVVRGRRTAPVSAAVDAAFAEAASEAVRNSVKHAGADGREVSRSTTLTLSDSRILLSIEDDGVGFEARDVRPHRLGILVSIRGRMNAIPGGAARIESSPGRGVLVELEWSES
jgi:signal transduction histidine kinase